MARGHAWQILRDTVNKRAVRILLECILVLCVFKARHGKFFEFKSHDSINSVYEQVFS